MAQDYRYIHYDITTTPDKDCLRRSLRVAVNRLYEANGADKREAMVCLCFTFMDILDGWFDLQEAVYHNRANLSIEGLDYFNRQFDDIADNWF